MTKQSITLGVAVSLSGRYALLGRQVLEGLECYVRDVNAAGGVTLKSEGKQLPVSLVVANDESDENKIRMLVEKLVTEFGLEKSEAVQIVNCMPKSVDELRVFLAGGRKIIEASRLEAIIKILDEQRKVK